MALFPLFCPVLVGLVVVVTYFIATVNKREGMERDRDRERQRESDRIESKENRKKEKKYTKHRSRNNVLHLNVGIHISLALLTDAMAILFHLLLYSSEALDLWLGR